MFLCMSILVGIGILIKYILISGQERWIVYGENVELYLFGMDRHEWGTIHLIIGFVLLGLLALHIILHWKVIISVNNRIFQRKLVKKLIAIVYISICVLFIMLPFLIKPTVISIEHGKGRQSANFDNNNKSNSSKTNTFEKDKFNHTEPHIVHKNANNKIEIRDYMTFDEISKRYKVPTEITKTSLNILKSIPDNQRLSGIRKKYDIDMNDIEKIVDEYQKNK